MVAAIVEYKRLIIFRFLSTQTRQSVRGPTLSQTNANYAYAVRAQNDNERYWYVHNGKINTILKV